MPVTPVLAHRWYDTPNIHLCTILDFVALCEEIGIAIERSVTLDRAGLPYRLNPRGTLANLLAEQGLVPAAPQQALSTGYPEARGAPCATGT